MYLILSYQNIYHFKSCEIFEQKVVSKTKERYDAITIIIKNSTFWCFALFFNLFPKFLFIHKFYMVENEPDCSMFKKFQDQLRGSPSSPFIHILQHICTSLKKKFKIHLLYQSEMNPFPLHLIS